MWTDLEKAGRTVESFLKLEWRNLPFWLKCNAKALLRSLKREGGFGCCCSKGAGGHGFSFVCWKQGSRVRGGDVSGMLSLLLLLEVKKNNFHQQLLDFSFGVTRRILVFVWVWCATLIFLSLSCVWSHLYNFWVWERRLPRFHSIPRNRWEKF